MRRNNLFWHINEQIRATEVRVVDENGKLLGILKKEEAVRLAREKGLTLIEIAPNAKPPVCKIAEFGKFRYQEEKKLRVQQKKTKVSELKEVRFSPFIAEHDYRIRLKKVKEFLEDKDKVKLTVVFMGRQLGSKKFGYDLLKKIFGELKDNITVDMEPKFLGRNLIMIVSPVNKSKKLTKQEVKIENAKA